MGGNAVTDLTGGWGTLGASVMHGNVRQKPPDWGLDYAAPHLKSHPYPHANSKSHQEMRSGRHTWLCPMPHGLVRMSFCTK